MPLDMNYQEIGRKLMHVEPLPDGDYSHLNKVRELTTEEASK
jgi:hypothetical protein